MALAASGTVSLELAANQIPMVIGYDMVFYHVRSRFASLKLILSHSSILFRTLVTYQNLLAPRASDRLSQAILQVLNKPECQLRAMKETMHFQRKIARRKSGGISAGFYIDDPKQQHLKILSSEPNNANP